MQEDFGEAVREARERRGWSQEFLAARVGATQSTIDRIESGATRRSRVLPEIAAALDLEFPGVTKPQTSAKPSTLTKVTYVLPTELLDRLNEYKQDIGIPSDDEAVRRLIDDALKHRDNYFTITERLIEKQKSFRSLREAAGYVLASHPLVRSMSFEGDRLIFVLNNGYVINVSEKGTASIQNGDNNFIKFKKGHEPSWAEQVNFANPYGLDDDIPF